MGSAVQPELVARAKSVIREEMIRVRGRLSDFERIEKSRQIARRLFELEVFRKSKAIFFFLSLPEEVQTEDMIREAFRLNKEVFVPLVNKEEGRLQVVRIPHLEIEFVRGEYGVQEPASQWREISSPDQLDLVVAPGLAFDTSGGRIGYGGGYYDRLLRQVPAEAVQIGVGFDFQVLDSIPRMGFDVPVQFVITETQSLRCLGLSDGEG
jgi:5-formyltetrahydrofolate cyclo-ligase